MPRDPGASIRAEDAKRLRLENEELKKTLEFVTQTSNKRIDQLEQANRQLQMEYEKMCEAMVQKASLNKDSRKGNR